MINKQLIEAIYKNDNNVIEELYHEYRNPFITWVQINYTISDADSKDLFQETMIILVTKIQNKKITEITSSSKTFIFSIGKQLIRNKLKISYNKGVREEHYYQQTNKYDL
jgi:DNA-directed RNA polymerase specialized sigma24 family protein